MSSSEFDRVVLIVLDGVGAGALPDACNYGDEGAHTLLHVAEFCGGLHLPAMQKMGLGNISHIPGVPPVVSPIAAFGRMAERSAGKDSIAGHWEIAGVVQDKPLPTYPSGFPDEIIDAFRDQTGLSPLGNIAASGTEIIKQLGDEHLKTGRPIVYTSADSVFQIAAHEEVIPVERLYEICRIARRILNPYGVARVIARPFAGTCPKDFKRTSRRHDFSLPPTGITVLDCLQKEGIEVYGVGKIWDIFAGRGISRYVVTESNADGMEKTLEALTKVKRGLVFTNLIDFDMLYGHRLDAKGFGRALEGFDRWLPRLTARLSDKDLLLITADHGCDPTTPGTDHTREYVPLLAWTPSFLSIRGLGIRETFSDVAATLADIFNLDFRPGMSMLEEITSLGD